MYVLKLDVDLLICAHRMCRSVHHCWHKTNEKVLRLVVHPSRHGVIPDIMQTLRPEQFPHLIRLEVSLPHTELQPSDVINDAQWQALWGLIMAPSSVEKLTINFGPLLFYGHTCGMAHLIDAMQKPSAALRHITLRGSSIGISMAPLTCAVVDMSSQLDVLEVKHLGSFVYCFEHEIPTTKLAFGCRQLQFTFESSQFVASSYTTNEILVYWDQLFSDPRLRRIVVIAFCMGLDHWPSVKALHPPPVVVVPGRHVTIVFQDRAFSDDSIFALNAFEWLERLAATASEVDFYSPPQRQQ